MFKAYYNLIIRNALFLRLYTLFANIINISLVLRSWGIFDATAKPVGDKGKKELPIKEVDLAAFVIPLALTALNFKKTSNLPNYPVVKNLYKWNIILVKI